MDKKISIQRRTLQQQLAIPIENIEAVNSFLLNPKATIVQDFLDVVLKYGTPGEINRKAEESRQLPALLERLKELRPDYFQDIKWLLQQRDRKAFIQVEDYRKKVLGENVNPLDFNEDNPVTLEISSCHYFPWLMDIARRAIDQQELMPGRVIKVRKMKEQEEDGDLLAFAAAMQVIGASYVEQLDTRGADGSNIHLRGPDTLIGYFGGVGEPNDYPLRWLDEFLYYYTRFGVRQVLNLNPGTILVGMFLHRLGIDIEYKISVALGNDNPYSAFWTLAMARLFAREDGSTPIVGLNWSNSTTNETIKIADEFRKSFNFENITRFEYHVTQTWKGVVIQPYCKRQQIVELAQCIRNISAKHEGGDPDVERERIHPSDIQDYYRDKDEIISAGHWDYLGLNFQDKFEAMNETACELTRNGIAFIAARNLHHGVRNTRLRC